MRCLRWFVTVVVLFAAASCTGGETPTPRPSALAFARGGTLRVILPPFQNDPLSAGEPALDPQGAYFFASAELFRCCLLRTLLSYTGQTTEEGGAQLRPDLAASLPVISVDGLTWTLRLKRGIRYAPPLQNVAITSHDFVRGFERAVKFGFAFAYGDVRGVDDYVAGRSASISGLETPTSDTLVVHLTAPAGDLGNRLASLGVVPIPPSPSDPSATFGVATGHDKDYGRFVVSSGPYMVQGIDRIDFSKPASDQQPASGFVPGHSITLVRNPSWRSATDGLRPAYVDRIEVTIAGTLEQGSAEVDSGKADLVLYPGPPPQAPLDQIERYQSDPNLQKRLHIDSRDFIRYVSMNLAQPPFDDVHIRKAVNYVLDKRRLLELRGGTAGGEISGHLVLNSMENNLLIDYDPYRTTSRADAISKAKAEMQQSAYDENRDGMCDADACRHVTGDTIAGPFAATLAAPITEDLREIGIRARITPVDPETVFEHLGNPSNHVALAVAVGFGKDYLNASTFLSLFTTSTISDTNGNNFSLVGATPHQLRRWGYTVRSVPNVDGKFRQCIPLVGEAQFQCWAEMDQLLMEQVVPWVPLIFEAYDRTVSARVASYSFDQSVAFPALDRIALKPGTE